MTTIPGYHIKTTLGSGGMATVYLATQQSLDRSVAIKVLDATLIDDPVIRDLFVQESKLIASLQHPNIVQVIDQGTTLEGQAYFVMPYIKSVALDTITPRNDIAITRKLDIVIQLCKALAYAHKNGVIHRDIKPNNILVDYDGHVRLVDFGIAGYFASNQPNNEPDNLIMGTAAYMAPEQHSSNTQASPLVDIYALGIVMHELFTGAKPTEKSLMHVVQQREQAQWLSLLMPIIERCIEPQPSKRFSDVDELRKQLLLLAEGKHLDSKRWRAEANDDNISANYMLLDVLKENPFGATYVVNDPKRNRLVVIKKQKVDQLGNAHFCAQKLTHIHHPHIARVFGSGKNYRVFIAISEYADGGSLQDRLSQAFPLGEWVIIAKQICLALQCAEENGFVHGNLRPSNILLAADNHVKLVDFGFPQHTYGKDADWYQAAGEKPSAQADIYSAGIILFELFTENRPTHNWFGFGDYWRLRHLPSQLRAIILRMIAKNPHKRFQKAADAAQAFDHFYGEQNTRIISKVLSKPSDGFWKKMGLSFSK